jgi:hypothetical protein
MVEPPASLDEAVTVAGVWVLAHRPIAHLRIRDGLSSPVVRSSRSMAGNTWEDRMNPRQRADPRFEHVRTCWTFLGPSGREITCGVFRVETGVELRVERAGELVRSQLFLGENAALEREAADWKQALLAKGFTEEVRY